MERLLIKSFFWRKTSYTGLHRGNKSLGWLWRRWNHGRKSDAAFRKIHDLQAESLWWSNGCNSTVLDDMHGSYREAASLSYCSTRGQFWWENGCVGVLLTLLLTHQQAQPCQTWQLVCTSDKKQTFTIQWRRDHLLCSTASEIQPPNRCWSVRRAITE